MEKERLIGLAKRGLQRTREFATTNRYAVPLGISVVGGGVAGTGLGFAIDHENVRGIIINGTNFGICEGAMAIILLKIRASKTSHQESGPQNNP